MTLTKVTYSMIQGTPANILDYGADPTGSSDSTSAIAAAIASGNNVYIPSGTYKVTAPNSTVIGSNTYYYAFKMQSGMSVISENGATLKLADNQSTIGSPKDVSMFFSNAAISNIVFENVTIDMNGANNKISPSSPSSYNRYNCSHILILGDSGQASNVYINNCSFINTAGTNCIVMGYTTNTSSTLGYNWKITNCLFKNNGLDTDDHSCVYGWADNVLVEGCTFTADQMQGTVGSTGMQAAYETHGAYHRFVNNKIDNSRYGMYVGDNIISACTGIIIDGNTIGPVKEVGIEFFHESSAAKAISNVEISNNVFVLSIIASVNTLKRGIDIACSYAIYDVSIKNNICSMSSGSTTAATFLKVGTQSVAGQSHSRIYFDNNETRNITYGVVLTSTATNALGVIEITNNRFVDMNVIGSVFTIPICVNAASLNAGSYTSYLNISNNTFYDSRGGSSQTQYGVWLAGKISVLYMNNNSYYGMASGNINNLATINNFYGEYTGTWTPVATNMSEVPGTGAVTYTGNYYRTNNLIHYKITITTTGTATFASNGGVTTITLPLSMQPDVCIAVNTGVFNSYGTGFNTSSVVYPPSWSAASNTVIISGTSQIITTN